MSGAMLRHDAAARSARVAAPRRAGRCMRLVSSRASRGNFGRFEGDIQTETTEWWQEEQPSGAAAAAPSTSRRAPPSQPQRGDGGGGRQQRDGGEGRGRGGGGNSRRQQQPQQRQRGRRDDDDDEDDAPGWWEVPREARAAAAAAAAATPLGPSQERRLRLAFAVGRRKVSVQALAEEVGLDRAEVTAWFKAFQALPAEERDALLEPLRAKAADARRALDAEAAEARAERDGARAAARAAAAAARAGGAAAAAAAAAVADVAAAFAAAAPDARAAMAQPRGAPAASAAAAPSSSPAPATTSSGRRLPAHVLRTLEGVYARTPYPSRDVIAGLHELHRLQRDDALRWFAARRDADGRPHDPRAAKAAAVAAAAAQRGVAAGDAVGVAGVAAAAGSWLGLPSEPDASLAAAAAAAGPDGAPAAAPPRVQMLTARELAALRSSAPSPRKLKGAKRAEELGIKAAPSGQAVEIAGVQYVAKDGAKAWTGAWRRRRAGHGLPAQRLDYQLMIARGGGGKGGGGSDGGGGDDDGGGSGGGASDGERSVEQ